MGDVKLYVAVTSREAQDMPEFLSRLKGLPLGIKVGLELFVSRGPDLLNIIIDDGFPLFLDLKFHDIPFTVAGAVGAACDYRPDLLNVHASGGVEMMKAAAEAAHGDTRVLAVTVLTSLNPRELKGIGLPEKPQELVRTMALAARSAGLHGVVCSPGEAAMVRDVCGEDFLIVTPGIRPSGGDSNDQKRISTPFDAAKAGATSLVVGRPVTRARDPRRAAESILSEVNLAFTGV